MEEEKVEAFKNVIMVMGDGSCSALLWSLWAESDSDDAEGPHLGFLSADVIRGLRRHCNYVLSAIAGT